MYTYIHMHLCCLVLWDVVVAVLLAIALFHLVIQISSVMLI